MKKGNKIFAIFISLCLLLTVLPLSAFAEPAEVASGNYSAGGIAYAGITWRLTDDGVLTVDGTGAIPDSVGMRMPYQNYKSQITALVIEDGITRIGNDAFYDLSNLTGILAIPDSVEEIGDAFYNCVNLTGVSCSSLEKWSQIRFGNFRSNPLYYAHILYVGGTLLTQFSWDLSATEIPAYMFCGCTSLTGDLVIPSGITSIGQYAFYGCTGSTGNIVISDTVTSIGDSAFQKCSGFIGTLTLGANLQTIGRYAFANCSGLTGGLVVPNGVTTVDWGAFQYCSGFNGTLTLGPQLQTIGDMAFSGCNHFTGSLAIPGSVTSIGVSAFRDCSGFTGTLTFDANGRLESIPDYAFQNCSGFTGGLAIPASVTYIGTYAFGSCRGFNALTFGANSALERILPHAFSSCTGFKGDLVIPDSVQTIHMGAFEGCSGFDGTLTLGTANSRLQTIGNYAFDSCTKFTGNLTIPNRVTSIGEEAFELCRGFNGTLTLGSALQTIGNRAFSDCYAFIGGLTIPDSVIEIGSCAFSACRGFNGSLTLGNAVQTIEMEAFYGCYNMTGVLQIPDSVTNIGDCAFHGCAANTDILTFFSQEERFIKKDLTNRTEPAFTAGEKVNGSETYTVSCACDVHTTDAQRYITTATRVLPYISVTAVTNTPTALTLGIEKTFALQPVLTPDNATYPQAAYVSGDASIAAVDENGVITAHAPGTTTVTVTPADGSDIGPAVISVTVYDLTVPEKIVLAAGDTASAAAIVDPDTAVTPDRTYTSSNEAAVTVDGNGLLTAVAAGTATITVTDGVLTKEFPVTVVDITASADITTLAKDGTATITVTALPEGTAAVQSITYASPDETVISVSDTGVVTALKTGTATVTVKATLLAAGETVTVEKTVDFTVYTPVTDIIATADRYVMDMEEIPFAEITVEVLPNDADNQNVTYTSSDPTVLEVEADGTVIALHKGTATVTITAADGYGASATLDFTVTHDLYALIVPPTLDEGETGTATVETDTVKTYTVEYISSDPEILTIDPVTGEYAAKKKGKVTVTAEITFEDGTTKTLTRLVLVRDPHEGEFRCKRCDWYDSVKDTPGITGIVYWMIHIITHMVQMINYLT